MRRRTTCGHGWRSDIVAATRDRTGGWVVAEMRPDEVLARERTGFGNPAIRVAMSPVGLVSFVMTRRMLHGIRARAERG